MGIIQSTDRGDGRRYIMEKLNSIMNEFCKVLIQVERNGIKIDTEALEELKKEYTIKHKNLEDELQILARKSLGDRPFRLGSVDDKSMVIYSRIPYSKKLWAKKFNLGSEMINGVRKPKKPKYMHPSELANNIKELSYTIHKTKAIQCRRCLGSGRIRKRLKSGLYSTKGTKCPTCRAKGIDYIDTDEVGGFKQLPSSVHDLSAHGYKCDKDKLEELARGAKGDAKQFLTSMVQFTAISHYLSAFISGIRENVGRDGILHTQFNQCVTTTGRLSSRNPNFHNQPRGGTFPIRKVVISRWGRGSITEADYAQLEFRVAAALSKDKVALKDIINGVDVHQRTADILTSAGQITSRQDAKTHTFKPLYGGMSGTKAERKYYREFLKRYSGIKKWHDKVIDIAIMHKYIVLPTERSYSFPWVKQSNRGYVSGSTKIKNYPVQGFATADIVPMATITLAKLYKENKLKSLIVNEVHDSIVTDTYPGEEEKVYELKIKAMLSVIEQLKTDFGYEFIVPLKVEVKNGINWLDMEVVKEGELQLNT